MSLEKKRQWVKLGLLAFLVFGLMVSFYHYVSENQDKLGHNENLPAVVNIGYLRVPNDEMIAIEQGKIKKELAQKGVKVKFMVFDSGVEANKALASGSIDFASMGVTNGVVALSKGLDVELIWLHELLGTNEALVTKNNKKVSTIDDLKGKSIATTFASTSHYSLQKVLETYGLTNDVKLLDMTTLDIAAAWKRGDIDGAYTWDPILSKLVSDNGKVIVSSADLVDDNIITANVMLGRKGFTHKNKELTVSVLSAISEANDYKRRKPQEAARLVAKALEIPKEDALTQMQGTIWLSAKEQLSSDYLGTKNKVGKFKIILKDISQFLYSSHSISKVPDDTSISNFINASYISSVVESRGK